MQVHRVDPPQTGKRGGLVAGGGRGLTPASAMIGGGIV